MCYRVECRSCGKYTWGGCGQHLRTLYGGIDEGRHCMCRAWPGVVIPNQHTTAAATSANQPTQSGRPNQAIGNPQTCEATSDVGLQ